MTYSRKDEMHFKKIGLSVCLLILTFSCVGCLAKPKPIINSPQVRTTMQTSVLKESALIAEVTKHKTELIKISELTIIPNVDNDTTEVSGTATNNNKAMCSFGFEIIYLNKDGTAFINEFIQIKDIKPGETKHFSDTLMGVDISKTTHRIQFQNFITYEKIYSII